MAAVDGPSRRAALSAGSALVTLCLAELFLQLAGVAPTRYRAPQHVESADKRWALDLYPDDPASRFELDLRDPAARARWSERIPGLATLIEQTPHGVPLRFTPELCRGESTPEDRPRVVVIGDSFTEGQGVAEGQTFVAHLDQALEARVIGCGRRGLDFPGLSDRFDEIVDALEPDLVVYAMVLNDPVRSDRFHRRQQFIDDWIVDRRRARGRASLVPPRWPPRLWQLIVDRTESWRVGRATTAWYRDMYGAANQEGWEATVDRIAAMNTRMDGRFLVAVWPLLVSLETYPFTGVHREITEALSRRGVATLDGLAAFEGLDETSLWVHPADRHPNATAHRRFARALRGRIHQSLTTLPSSRVDPLPPGRDRSSR